MKSKKGTNSKYTKLFKWSLLTAAYFWFFFFSNIYAESPGQTNSPSLVSSLRVETPIEFCGEEVPIKDQEVLERFEKEFLISLWDRPQVILWLKRSKRYLPHIEQILKKNEMPGDLKYVAIAESALRPHVGSPKGAMGFWQFTAGTGRKYGLAINKDIDERRNIFASTQAAIRYFKELHDTFESWTLAVAAFNMGEEGLMTEIMEQDIKDFYQLYLPLETQRFILRIVSVKLILNNPDKYGFHLIEKDYYPPLSFDQIQVMCLDSTPIRIIAKAAETQFKVIKDLNPEIRGYYLTSGNHNLLIPKGAAEGFQDRFDSYIEKYQAAKKERVYIVKSGDNLSTIAERFDIPLAALVIWNHLDLRRPIHPGDRLIVYGGEEGKNP